MLRLLVITTGILYLWGCHSTRMHTPNSLHRLWGSVHSSHGFATKDSVVIVTDLGTTDEIAMTRVTAQGTFAVDISAKQVSLTITNPKGWAYLPKVDVDGRKLDIQLSSDCMPLQGQVHVDGPLPQNAELVRIARFSDEVGDMFATSLDGERRFEACLPRAQYQITLSPQFANRLIAGSVPQETPLSILATSLQSAKTAPRERLGLEPTSQDGFVKQLPEVVRLIGLGESNHGTREFTLERTSLMLELARQRGFTTVLIEAAHGGMLPANAYIHGAAVDLDFAISRIGFWLWKTEEIRQALEAFRTYNQTVAPDQQISIIGIDVQQPEGDIDDLLGASIGLTPDQAELLARLRDQNGVAWNKFSQSEQEITRRSLEQVASTRDHRGLASETNRHALSARSLLFSLDFVEKSTQWEQSRTRDRAMAQLALTMFDIEPGLRATLWAHLGHVSREGIVGIPPLGFHLSAALGERYQNYALLAYQGAARAKDFQRMTMPAVAFPVAAAPAYALEGVLASSVQDGPPDVTYWNFGAPSARKSHWLNELHWLRAFGGAYPGDERSHELYNLGAIDGAVLFKKVTPSRPLKLPAPPPPAANPSP